MQRKISLITMGQGNVLALKNTLDSFKGIVDEVVYGDLLIFEEDREVVKSYEKEFNLRSIRLPFNYIFQMGFSKTLNYLISNAKNDMVMYMNTSEVIDEDYGINKIIDDNLDCNAFYFSHRVEKHRWFRCFDKNEIQWQGLLHEEPYSIKEDMRPYHKPIFMMRDEEKDMGDTLKASVFNSVKEMCYFQNLIRMVNYPKLSKGTNEGWLNFAKDEYKSMKDRLEKKGDQYTAFKLGDFEMFLNEINTSDYFEKERFESSDSINFQGNRKVVL